MLENLRFDAAEQAGDPAFAPSSQRSVTSTAMTHLEPVIVKMHRCALFRRWP